MRSIVPPNYVEFSRVFFLIYSHLFCALLKNCYLCTVKKEYQVEKEILIKAIKQKIREKNYLCSRIYMRIDMSKQEKEAKVKEFWEYYEATQGTITITDPTVLD